MSVTVFLSNTNIQIVVGSGSTGSAKVSRFVSVGVPNGAVLNGVVMDDNALITALKECWRINKLPKGEVTLILNSPQFRASIVDMPIMADKKTTEYILRETKDGRLANPVTSWYLLDKTPKEKKQRVIAETTDAQFIDTYIDIFAKAGLKLSDIHEGVSLAIGLLSGATRNKTVVYMILDGTSLVMIFFSKGQYYYHSTKRIFNQPGTAEFAKEIFGAISEIRQFASAQHLEDVIENVQFAGLSEQQVSRLADDMLSVDSNITLSSVACPSYVRAKKDSNMFPYFVYPVAGLTKINKSRYDIMTAKKQSAEKFKKKKSMLKVILPAAGFLLLLVLIYAALTGFGIYKQQKLKELNRSNNNSTTLENVARYEEITEVITGVGSRQGGLNLFHEYIDSYPVPDSEINQIITDAANAHSVKITINSYDASTGVFSITAESADVEQINQFIADLMRLPNFEKIDYTGYHSIDDDNGNLRWQINVVCTLAPRVVEETVEVTEEEG